MQCFLYLSWYQCLFYFSLKTRRDSLNPSYGKISITIQNVKNAADWNKITFNHLSLPLEPALTKTAFIMICIKTPFLVRSPARTSETLISFPAAPSKTLSSVTDRIRSSFLVLLSETEIGLASWLNKIHRIALVTPLEIKWHLRCQSGERWILETYITNTNAGPSETILICHQKVDQTLHIDLCVSVGVKQSPDLVGDKPACAGEYELKILALLCFPIPINFLKVLS